MTSQKPPRDVTRPPREPRGTPSREHEQRLISQLTIKRNSVLLQLRAAERGDGGGDLETTRRSLERLAQELDRHLAAVSDASGHKDACVDVPLPPPRGRRLKRPAPAPPASSLAPFISSLSTANSAPDLANAEQRGRERIDTPSSRRRLKKSLSLSGSRSFFATMLAAIRGNNRSRVPALYRRSRSQESLQLAPLDQDQKIVNEAAVRAQQRRGTKLLHHTRSQSAEPRQFLASTKTRHGSGSERTPKRPNYLPLPQSIGRSRYNPRERSPLTMRVSTPHETHLKTPTPELISSEKYFVAGVSEAALNEIAAFEKLIANFMSKNVHVSPTSQITSK